MDQQQALDAITQALRTALNDDTATVTIDTDLLGEEILDSLDGMVFLLELSAFTDKKFPENDLKEQGFFRIREARRVHAEPLTNR
jgi:acyl carrier protein